MHKYTDVKIGPARLPECTVIATLYRRALPDSFLSDMGVGFLSILFATMITHDTSVICVAKHNNKVIGYVCGTVHTDDFYRYFYTHNSARLLWIVITKILHPRTLYKILENIVYPKKKNADLPDAEFLSIAVDPHYQGNNIGELLFTSFNRYMKKLGVHHYKIIVGSKLTQAQKYYSRMGCKMFGKIEVHKNELSYIYTYTIK